MINFRSTGAFFTRKYHLSWFVVIFFVGAILGIVSAYFVDLSNVSAGLFLVTTTILLFLGVTKRLGTGLLMVMVAGSCVGVLRVNSLMSGLAQYEPYFGRTVELHGSVVDDVVLGDQGDLRIKLDAIRIDDQSFTGEVWTSVSTSEEIRRNDVLYLKGFLTEGFGSFAATVQRPQIEKIVRESAADTSLQLRDDFADRVRSVIDEPESSLGLGFLVGLKSSLPPAMSADIKALALTHIVVASGYNLTILVSFSRRIFEKFSKYLSAFVAGSMIVGFIMITGFSPSMTRAGLVAGMSLLAWYYGRKIHPLSLIIIAAAITLLVRPSYIFGDLGWYLSFAAFFGILVLAPLIHHYFWGVKKKPSALRELIVSTLSAQVMTLPIILGAFGTFSVYALPANILILPVIPLAMLFTFMAGMATIVVPFMSGIIALPASILLGYCTFMITKLANLPNAIYELDVQKNTVIALFIVLLFATFYLYRKTKHNFMKDRLIIE